MGETTFVSAVDTAYGWNVTLVQQMLDNETPALAPGRTRSGMGRQLPSATHLRRKIAGVEHHLPHGGRSGAYLTSPSTEHLEPLAPRPTVRTPLRLIGFRLETRRVGKVSPDDRFLQNLVCRAQPLRHRRLRCSTTPNPGVWTRPVVPLDGQGEQNHRLGAWRILLPRGRPRLGRRSATTHHAQPNSVFDRTGRSSVSDVRFHP